MANEPLRNTNKQNDSDILSFKNIFYFFGRSAPRLLIYGLVSLILTTLILTIIYFVNISVKPGYAVAQIEFNYPGIEKGLDPAGQILDTSYLKSPTNITKTLNQLNSSVDTNLIRNNLIITPIVPANIAAQNEQINKLIETDPANWALISQLNYYANRFMVELVDESVGNAETKEILNELLNQYRKYFKSRYYEMNTYDFNMIKTNDMDDYDFYNVINIYDAHLSMLETYLAEFLNGTKEHRSSITTQRINEALSTCTLLREFYLKPAKNLVFNSYVTKNTMAEYKRLISTELMESSSALNIAKDVVDALKDQIDKFEKDSLILVQSENGEYVELTKPTELYETLNNKLLDAEQELAIAKQRHSEIQTLHAAVMEISDGKISSDAEIAKVNSYISSLNTSYNTLISTTADAVTSFLDNEFMIDAIRVVVPASYQNPNLNLSPYIISLLIVVFLTEATALIQTGVKIYKEKQVREVA